MNFLKNLLGGSGGGGGGATNALYFYVRPRGCEEVIEVRINPANDLSLSDEDDYFVRKTVRGQHRCFNPAEMTLTFDSNRNLKTKEVAGGELLDRTDYDAWQEKMAARKATIREQNAAVDAANAATNETTEDE